MKLDRNIEGNEGRGKYALLKMREIPAALSTLRADDIKQAIERLEDMDVLDWGTKGSESEFFVIRLKDKYAEAALLAYARAAAQDNPEWAEQVAEMASRAGEHHPDCKQPD